LKRIISYNVNGIRAALRKGLIDWLKVINPDIVCLQEIKAQNEQIPVFDFVEAGYINFWFPAKRKGYSGVAILTKTEPDKVVYGMGIEKYDDEGRFLRADYGDISVVSVYFPSGSSGDERQAFKIQWLADFQKYINELKKSRPNIILAGDYNICHEAIDIHDPIRNAKVSGFLPEERKWMTQFLNSGFTDSFRYFNNEPNNWFY
jgi:exodeoxyribonuclease-3